MTNQFVNKFDSDICLFSIDKFVEIAIKNLSFKYFYAACQLQPKEAMHCENIVARCLHGSQNNVDLTPIKFVIQTS
jgi:hypothetical protein